MSIKKREVFYSTKGGQVKFLDWAYTTTTIGTCAEPFCVDDRGPGAVGENVPDFDPSDMMVKVDALARVEDEVAVKNKFQGVHGGNLRPRVLIFTGNF